MRYVVTILAILFVIFLIWGINRESDNKRRCEAKGGVMIDRGFTCVKKEYVINSIILIYFRLIKYKWEVHNLRP